jgi:hypothetical protein
MERPNQIFNYTGNSIAPLKNLNVKGNASSRLTYMNIGQICIKIKSEDLIRSLIG